jgi:hypothetical protein
MKSISVRVLFASLLVAVVFLCLVGPQRTQARTNVAVEPVPVEPSMHEFMEYEFQPTYLRLKAQMAAQPADNQAWKAIKSDSLILAEGGNLLLSRLPEKDAQAWQELSVQVRSLGGELYKAAKKKDYKSAHEHYQAMLVKCNACHQQFAKGEHQLAP